MAKKIYVGNLSFQTTEAQVRDLFAEYGEVESVAWVTDRDSGRFRGFCFVEMDGTAADAAIAALDGKEIDGRNLRINEARPRETRSGGGFRGERSGGGGYRGGGGRGGERGGGGYRSGGGDRSGDRGSRRDSNRRDDFPDSGGGRRW